MNVTYPDGHSELTEFGTNEEFKKALMALAQKNDWIRAELSRPPQNIQPDEPKQEEK